MKRLGIVVYPNFQIMSLAALPVFEFANMPPQEPHYDVRIISETGGSIRSSSGLVVESEVFDDPAFDTLIVSSSTRADIETPSPGLLDFLRAAVPASRRVASICSGTFVLAEAGILDGRRATTHWYHAPNLQARYPKVKIDEDRIFIIDGSIWTSAGMTAGIDLALAMVERDMGGDVAKLVAKLLVVSHRRSGGQLQYSTLLDLDATSDRIQKVLTYVKGNLRSSLSINELAAIANLSPRQFSRAFQSETGQSPAKAVEKLRVEAARAMMEQSTHQMDVIARETGFADRARMRRAFVRLYGDSPQVIRRNGKSMPITDF